METITVTLKLPSDVASQAENAGLLQDEAMTNLLVKELERLTRINRFFEDVDKLIALQPPLTLEEIEAEIAAARAESN